MSRITEQLTEMSKEFSDRCLKLNFTFDGFVYNPLDYARANYEEYLSLYVKEGAKALFLGMNPGPYGMLQTGVPFGEINAVKNYLKIDKAVGKPEKEHPQRPVLGMKTQRSEVSGLRFWALIEKKYPDSKQFPKDLCVMNFCPLGFLSSSKSAKNITPDKLLKEERDALEELCMYYLKETVQLINPEFLVGVGKYAQEKLLKVNEQLNGTKRVLKIIHPSPANPRANKDWAPQTEELLIKEGVWK